MSGSATPPPESTGSEDGFLRSLPRHRHNLSSEQVRASQSGRIMLAAAEVIAERGYAAATVIEIAKRAGVSRKTFYELFDGKEDAFLAAYDGVSILIQRTAAAAPAVELTTDADAEEAATTAAVAMLATLAAQPALTRMFFLEALGAGPRIRLRRDAAIEQFAASLAALLSHGRATLAPDLGPVDHELARAVVGAGIEAIVRHLVHHTPETLTDLAPELVNLLRHVALPVRTPG